jgi:two-component system sensor histidine kinase CreC
VSLGFRILLGNFLLVGLAGWFVVSILMEEVKPSVRQTMEDTLVDSAHALAGLAAEDLRDGKIATGTFARALRQLGTTPVDAQIWQFGKHSVGQRVHVMDSRGLVVFDSDGLDTGQDFSRWHDVHRTLQGRYGARSTRTDPNDPTTSVMHVAAPIRDGGRIIGVLSVSKPTGAVAPFVNASRQRILTAGLWLLGLSLAIGVAMALWLTGSLRQLLQYAERVGAGDKVAPPKLASPELATLSRALASMREKLEGKQYVERYVHNLTHELKSPLTAIAASAELLQDDLPAADRQRFAGHIQTQASRLQQLIERMLGLASVESQQRLQQHTEVPLQQVVDELLADRAAQLATRSVTVDCSAVAPVVVPGDRFLLRQAIGNLLDNALQFGPDGGEIALTLQADATDAVLTVRDQGPGIPDFAMERVFERFFSLPRPGGGAKSTGLGLPFVREVAALHRGEVTLANHLIGEAVRGAVATLRLPLRLPPR